MAAMAFIDGKGIEVPVEKEAVDVIEATAQAEEVFARLNHGSGCELPGYTGRSMMVGDVVHVGLVDGAIVALRCAGIGWEVLNAAEVVKAAVKAKMASLDKATDPIDLPREELLRRVWKGIQREAEEAEPCETCKGEGYTDEPEVDPAGTVVVTRCCDCNGTGKA